MKRFILAIMFLSFFGLHDVFADVPTYPDLSALPDLPYSYSGYTYTDRIVYIVLYEYLGFN